MRILALVDQRHAPKSVLARIFDGSPPGSRAGAPCWTVSKLLTKWFSGCSSLLRSQACPR